MRNAVQRKTAELREVESRMRALDLFNHRQVEVIRHALKHPGQRYTFTSHQKSHNVVYQTARTDLLDLAERGALEKRKRGKQLIFIVPADLPERLMNLEKLAAYERHRRPDRAACHPAVRAHGRAVLDWERRLQSPFDSLTGD